MVLGGSSIRAGCDIALPFMPLPIRRFDTSYSVLRPPKIVRDVKRSDELEAEHPALLRFSQDARLHLVRQHVDVVCMLWRVRLKLKYWVEVLVIKASLGDGIIGKPFAES